MKTFRMKTFTTRTAISLLLALPLLADVAGPSWRDYALGTSFDVQVESQHRKLYPPDQKPTIETSMEHWKLVKKDDQTATFEVTSGDQKTEETLPLTLDPLPVSDDGKQGQETHTKVEVDRETITTPLGTFECTRIRRLRSMNDAGGEDVEWRAMGFPIAIKTYSKWSHKQQEDIETRTVVRFTRGK
jgi:hypothetical protein